ncbi:putative nepenthesin [Lupinus albus]|uniref:Putative nepenthesin n=1 Tax=Lupinus albus TaxID=3870 RepID=A0A6A4R5L5_LUPAL|nr:putative nepenthesin [Lupinus albus]
MIMGYPILFHISFLFVPFFILLSTIKVVNGGFSVKMIRINSTKVAHLLDNVQSPTHADLGVHILEMSFGNPSTKYYGIIDTGSDLIWTQCLPCDNCFPQKYPYFDPKKSSTYTNVYCQEDECNLLKESVKGCSSQNQCTYRFSYLDTSITQGLLALDTITLQSSSGGVIPLQYMIFGCGHNNSGGFDEKVMGIVGLGQGPLSLISQIGPSFGGRRFSYCLVPYYADYNLPSIMSFGSGSEVIGDGVVSTPLIKKESKSFYYVTLQGISVGDTYLSFHSSSKGNMIIDSATTFTILPQKLYDQLVEEVKKQVPLQPIINDPQFGDRLCYRTINLEQPIITTHFEGADIQLKTIQTFYQPNFGVFCLAFGSIRSDFGIYGNLAQTNYLIGFDLESELVSFKAIHCNLHQSLV